MASGSPQQQQQQPTKTKLAELRTAMGSAETDKQWANQCMRLAQAVKLTEYLIAQLELDQLLDKFTEKLDDFCEHTPYRQQANGPGRVIVSAVAARQLHTVAAHCSPLPFVATHRYSQRLQATQQSIVGDHRGVVTGGRRPSRCRTKTCRRRPSRPGASAACGEIRKGLCTATEDLVRPAAATEDLGRPAAEQYLRILWRAGPSNLRIWEARSSQLRIWEAGSSNSEDLGGRQQQLRIWRGPQQQLIEDHGRPAAATEDLEARAATEAACQPQTHQSPPRYFHARRQLRRLQQIQLPNFSRRLALASRATRRSRQKARLPR
uniref:Uncharacterized protein n=1 Tax=Macrostomum lignano TaxID=282301 RepID=A0A1I8FDN7_9PLAT